MPDRLDLIHRRESKLHLPHAGVRFIRAGLIKNWAVLRVSSSLEHVRCHEEKSLPLCGKQWGPLPPMPKVVTLQYFG